MKFGLKDEVISRIQSTFRKFPELEEAVLYGSRAKGTYKDGSDIDLVLKGPDLDLAILNKIRSSLDDLLLPQVFDLSNESQIDNEELLEHIRRVGKRFYKK